MMFALIDCNNFYASCERLFRPDLREKPIVVLSSGDGCVIARSNEAKVLGVKMGEPYYKIKPFCDQNKVHVFSSNFTLYRDMSQRVMSIIEEAWENTEIYSIDEAFLDLSTMNPLLHDVFCLDLQKLILKCTGIPVSIGLGATKTLAKISNHIAKKELKVPVFNITNQRDWLKKIAVGDVWGIGRQWSKKLIAQGIYSAYDLTLIDTAQLQKQYNIVLMQKALELQGVSCVDLHDHHEPRKSILSSRSFSKMQTEFDALFEAVSLHCANAYEKLRAQQSLTYSLTVFLKTNRHRQDLPQYSPCASIQFIAPTDDIRLMTQQARRCLEEIYKPGFYYKKAGVYLTQLTNRAGYQQQDLFAQPSEKNIEKSQAFLNVFDKINKRFGKHSVRLACLGFDQSWDTQFQHKSPAYTTRWSQLAYVTTN